MSDGERPAGGTTIRLAWDAYDGLAEERRAFRAEHGFRPSWSDIVLKLLADRKAWRAMGEAAREADRKPVPS